jgi:hypothetical protein
MGREQPYNGNPKVRSPLWSAAAHNTRFVPCRVLSGPFLRNLNRLPITAAIMCVRDPPVCATAVLIRRRGGGKPGTVAASCPPFDRPALAESRRQWPVAGLQPMKAGFAHGHPRVVTVRCDSAAATIDRPNRRPVHQLKFFSGRAGGVSPTESTRGVEDTFRTVRRPGGPMFAGHLQHRALALHLLEPLRGLGSV